MNTIFQNLRLAFGSVLVIEMISAGPLMAQPAADPTNMVWIAPGTFQMGDANGEPDELPLHSVTLTRGYWMSRFEVTQGEYLAIVGTNPSAFSGDLSLPVENVTWHNATNFCAKFTQQELLAGRLPAGYAYRLPTEAEWEYAARAGSTTYYTFGPRALWPQLTNYAWLNLNSGNATHPVGLKLPNAWGLYDVHGNVWEWVADWFEPYSTNAPLVDPTGPATGTARVTRSSGYSGNLDHCRTADRSWSQPGEHYSIIGFRVVLAVAAVLTWTGVVSSDWNNPTNWSPQQIPTAIDHVIINSGSVTVPANGVFAIMDWTGGEIDGSLTVASGATVNWSRGGVVGPLTVATNGVVNLTGSGEKNIGGPLTNAGMVVWAGSGDVYVVNSGDAYHGLVENLAGGLWDIQSDSSVYPYFSGGWYFRNAGTVRKSASTGTTSIGIPFYNTGIVEAQTGTINFNGGGSLGGINTTAAGTAINLTGGSFTAVGLPLFSGGGQSRFAGGTLTLATDLIPNLSLVGGNLILGPAFQGGTITNLTLTGTTLVGTNIVSGTFNWGGGEIDGSLTVASGATLNWSRGGVAGPLTVATNGVLNLTGSGEKNIGGPLTNAGMVVWAGSGDVYVVNNGSPFNGLIENLAGGLWDIQSDSSVYPYFSGGWYFRNAGTVRKSAGSGATTILIPFYNTGTVEASQGALHFDGGYSGGSSAYLAISLGGTATGSGYGQIAFSSPLNMIGAFNVSTRNGYVPNPGDTFQILSYPSATNEFTCLSGLDLGAGVLLLPQFGPTRLTLTATAYATNNAQPQLFITPSRTGVRVTWPLGFPSWVLQSTTNPASLFWSTVPLACDNQALLPVTSPEQFFRLKQ